MNARAIAPTLPPPKAQAASTGRSSLPALYAGNGLTLSGLRLQTMIFAWIALEAAGEGWVGLINGLPVIAACLFAAWGGLLADSAGARRAMTSLRFGLAGRDRRGIRSIHSARLVNPAMRSVMRDTGYQVNGGGAVERRSSAHRQRSIRRAGRVRSNRAELMHPIVHL